jgi:arylsulfatase A-like enzyme
MLPLVATSLLPLLMLLQLSALNGPEVVVLATGTPSQPSEPTKQHGTTTNSKGKIKQQRNNILLLLTDDQDIVLGSFDTASYMPVVHDKLCNQGTTFAKGALVHVPICCPSRSSLLTGKYLHHGNLAINNSVVGNCYSDLWKTTEEDHHTLAVHAQDAGYTTLYAGKYLNQYKHHDKHNISDGIPKGWDYWYGLEEIRDTITTRSWSEHQATMVVVMPRFFSTNTEMSTRPIICH